jgi:flagellar L-ring protein precursor FlgH
MRHIKFATLAFNVSLLSCFVLATNYANAQNGSLLHAPLTGTVLNNSPRARVQLPYPQNSPQQMPNEMVQLGPVGQQGSATRNPADKRPTALLSNTSWTYEPAPPTRVFRKNDVVTIRVDEITRVAAEGSAENRKRTLYEVILTDWIRIQDFKLRPDAQSNGDPSVAFESNSNYRAESNVESRESVAFNIAATIVDVRPNGNMLLEARKKIRVNDNLWETSLTGLCRAEDITPDNVVLSKDLIDLEVTKQDRGHLRDGYSRGWFQRWLDRLGPF